LSLADWRIVVFSGRSIVPGGLKQARFTESFIRNNHLEGSFGGWLFYPGMLFGTAEKWWDVGSSRKDPHEGLDFCLYEDVRNGAVRLDGDTRIPVVYGGTIVKVFDDFLGKSIVVEHRTTDAGEVLLSIYGHTQPLPGLSVGRVVAEGEAVATLAVPRRSRSSVHPHLHVSLMRKGAIRPEEIDWSRITVGSPDVIDPLDILDGPYRLAFPPPSLLHKCL
jgi:hypothetical protein